MHAGQCVCTYVYQLNLHLSLLVCHVNIIRRIFIGFLPFSGSG